MNLTSAAARQTLLKPLPVQRWAYVALFGVALLVRLGYVLVVGTENFMLSADARGYHDIAVNLVTRQHFMTLMDPPHQWDALYATRPPLTPFFLAAIYLVTGPSQWAAQLVLSVVGAASCVLIALLGRRLFGPGVGLLAGLLAGFYPFFVFLASIPLTENLAILLYVALVILLLKTRDTARGTHAGAAGAVLALAALNKPTILGFLPLLAAWFLFSFRFHLARGASLLGLTLLTATLVMAPWTARNYVHFGALIPVTTQAGWNLYEANGFHTDYAVALLEQGTTGWYDRKDIGLPLQGLAPLEAERKARSLALQFMRAHPMKFAELALRKSRIFWGAYPHPLHQLSWGIMSVLGVVGILLAQSRWRDLVLIYLLTLQTASIPIFFTAMPRFRAPIEPFLILMAAVAIVEMGRRLRGLANAGLPQASRSVKQIG